MIKIGVFSIDLVQKDEMRNQISEYLESLNIEYQITLIKNKSSIVDIIKNRITKINIVIMREGNQITYFKAKSKSTKLKYDLRPIGWLEAPLDREKINYIINNGDNFSCPYGIFNLITKDEIRMILHEDIEYITNSNKKTIICLRDGEMVQSNESVKKIKDKLPEDIFMNCIKGTIVNCFHLRRIDKVNFTITMDSGYIIQANKNNIKKIIRNYFKAVSNLFV